jgi:hypothetical protein
MKYLLSAFVLAFSLNTGATYAAETAVPKKEPSPAQKAQQEKMRTCNKEAKEKALKGDERKAFMKGCLSSGKSAAARTTTSPQKKDEEKGW